MYPKSLDSLINSFLKLPGVGKKTAERYAYSMINKDKDEIQRFIDSLTNSMNKIDKCPVCGFLMEDNECFYCSNKNRDNTTILVVEEPKDVEAIERCDRYHGLYHVLGGAISPINGIGPEELNIVSLINRIDGSVKELIIATSATVEGEATALYLKKIFSDKDVVVSRIAYGMPVGSSLEYSDESTISRALQGRQKI